MDPIPNYPAERSQPRTGRRAEYELHRLILDQCLDDIVLEYILNSGRPQSYEGFLWDYKRELPNTSGRGTEDNLFNYHLAIAELMKDIVSFHNAYGGYILAGIDQYAASLIVGCPNIR